jgi:hypothetical protein
LFNNLNKTVLYSVLYFPEKRLLSINNSNSFYFGSPYSWKLQHVPSLNNPVQLFVEFQQPIPALPLIKSIRVMNSMFGLREKEMYMDERLCHTLVIHAVQLDSRLHELLALVDALSNVQTF